MVTSTHYERQRYFENGSRPCRARVFASFCIVTTTLTPSVPAEATDATVTQVSGDLVTAENGLPVSGATISLVQGSTVVATATSDTNGHYTFGNVTPGIYTLRISAQGLQTTEISNVLAGTGGSIAIRTTLRANAPKPAVFKRSGA